MSSDISRRDLVRSSTVLAAATVVPANWLHATNDRTPDAPAIRLGLASYTFRNFDRKQLIGFMRELSVTDLNAKDVKDHLPTDPPQEEAALADYQSAGIGLHAAGVIYFTKSDDADIRSKFDYCKRAGVKVIVAGDPTPEMLRTLERFVGAYDTRVAIHNHGPEDNLWHSPLDVLKVIKNMDPRIGCCIDVGHTMRAETDVVEAIHAAGSRLFNVHIKDLKNARDKESQVAVGEGIMPVRKIFEALLSVKYPGFVDLEYEIQPDNPMPGVIASFAYMRGVLSGMGVSAPLNF